MTPRPESTALKPCECGPGANDAARISSHNWCDKSDATNVAVHLLFLQGRREGRTIVHQQDTCVEISFAGPPGSRRDEFKSM